MTLHCIKPLQIYSKKTKERVRYCTLELVDDGRGMQLTLKWGRGMQASIN